tara:strand:+ start:948 stop:1361 length:414 start_codon:yes stop_codon:yes gene_type:complete
MAGSTELVDSRFPMTCKDYRSEDWRTEPIENLPAIYNNVRGWIDDKVETIHTLHADHREHFKTLFGKPSFYFTSEFRFHCYALDLGDAKIVLLTAKGKGTCYEVIIGANGVKQRKNPDKIIRFMDALINDLENLENG